MTTKTKEYNLDKSLERMKASSWEMLGAVKMMFHLVAYGIGMWGFFTMISGFMAEDYLKELLGWIKMGIGLSVFYASTKFKVSEDD